MLLVCFKCYLNIPGDLKNYIYLIWQIQQISGNKFTFMKEKKNHKNFCSKFLSVSLSYYINWHIMENLYTTISSYFIKE